MLKVLVDFRVGWILGLQIDQFEAKTLAETSLRDSKVQLLCKLIGQLAIPWLVKGESATLRATRHVMPTKRRPIAEVPFVDGVVRPRVRRSGGRQFVIGDDGKPVYGVWLRPPDEPREVGTGCSR
jgi:hypothetical protein